MIRQTWHPLRFNMGIPILVRRHLYFETAPSISPPSSSLHIWWYLSLGHVSITDEISKHLTVIFFITVWFMWLQQCDRSAALSRHQSNFKAILYFKTSHKIPQDGTQSNCTRDFGNRVYRYHFVLRPFTDHLGWFKICFQCVVVWVLIVSKSGWLSISVSHMVGIDISKSGWLSIWI